MAKCPTYDQSMGKEMEAEIQLERLRIKNHYNEFKRLYTPEFRAKGVDVVNELTKIAENIEGHVERTGKAVLSGAAIGTIGTSTLIGSLIAAPFTGGLSLVAAGIGLGIGASGATISTVSEITRSNIVSNRGEEAKKISDEYVKDLNALLVIVGKIAECFERIHFKFSNNIAEDILLGIDDSANVFKIIGVAAEFGSAAGKVAKVVSVAAVGLAIVVDSILLGFAIKDAVDGYPSENAERLRKTVKELKAAQEALDSAAATFAKGNLLE